MDEITIHFPLLPGGATRLDMFREAAAAECRCRKNLLYIVGVIVEYIESLHVLKVGILSI